MLNEVMRADLEYWMQYLATSGPKLTPERFQELATYIADVESEKPVSTLNREDFQKKVDADDEAAKANPKTGDDDDDEDDKKKPKRMFAPTRVYDSITDVMEHASLVRYSPPSGFSGLEPGSGNTAGMIMPGTDPLQNPSSEMWSQTDGEPIGDGPEAHTADGGTTGGSNITLEVWPEGFCNLLVGGKPTGSATIGGMVTGGRSSATEPSKTRKLDDDTELPVQPIRVVLTNDSIRALISKADEGLEYRRQLELDGVRYIIARDQGQASPDLHLRVMRTITDIKDLKRYVEDLRESAIAKYRANPQVSKDIQDFLRIPERQTASPASGIGTREFVKKPGTKGSEEEPYNDAKLYKA